MKIGITGDTHGNQQIIRKIIQKTPPVEMWLHTGDYSQDAYLLESMSGLPVIKVAGNCDRGGSNANPDEIFPSSGGC